MTYIHTKEGYCKGPVTMEKPECFRNNESDEDCPECNAYHNHLASLQEFPLLNPEGIPVGELFDGVEKEQVLLSYGQGSTWYFTNECDPEVIEAQSPVQRRILIIPVQAVQHKEEDIKAICNTAVSLLSRIVHSKREDETIEVFQEAHDLLNKYDNIPMSDEDRSISLHKLGHIVNHLSAPSQQAFKGGYLAGASFALGLAGGLRWVGVGDIKPPVQKLIVLRHVSKESMYLGNFDENEEGAWLFIQGSEAYKGWTIEDYENNFSYWEYLSDSPTLPSREQELKEENEAIRNTIKDYLKGMVSDDNINKQDYDLWCEARNKMYELKLF